jgi:hypothetical protein
LLDSARTLRPWAYFVAVVAAVELVGSVENNRPGHKRSTGPPDTRSEAEDIPLERDYCTLEAPAPGETGRIL